MTGKYGYVDDSGKLRVVEYGANRHGFQPSGTGITVPPPTLVQLRPDDEDDKNDEDDAVDATPEARRPRPQQQVTNKRPSPPAVKAQQNELPASRDYEYDDGFAQQQQQQPGAGFDDGDSPAGWAVRRPDDQHSWTRQPQEQPEPAAARPRVPAQLYRPAPTAARFGASGAARPKSPSSRPPVGGSFEPVPSVVAAAEGPSGSYRSVQDFGGARRDPSAGRRLAAAAAPAPAPAERSYETYENQDSDSQPPLYRPVPANTAARRNGGGGGVPAGFAAAPSARQMRAGGVLDQLAEQYALPESGSPVSHSVSFGLDQ